MKIAILEDASYRVEIFRSYLNKHDLFISEHTSEMIGALKVNKFDVLFLDHDLYGTAFSPSGPNTGWEVADWLDKNPQHKPGLIIVHSKNDGGSAEIIKKLPSAKRMKFPSSFIENVEFFRNLGIVLANEQAKVRNE